MKYTAVKRTLIELDQIPEYAKQASIAIEDKDFYNHHGLYFRGLPVRSSAMLLTLGPKGAEAVL